MVEEQNTGNRNALGQPVGNEVEQWTPPALPALSPLVGRYCRLELLGAETHAVALHLEYTAQSDGRDWTYMPYGPFHCSDDYGAWILSVQAREDTMLFAIVDQVSGCPLGVAGYLRMQPASGSIEVGHISYSPALQRTVAATEAMYLLMRRAFEELGYRRYEWKCDSLNQRSRQAAARLGFEYEGTFRQAAVVKGRNRDTAWFSIIDTQWPRLRTVFVAYLAPENFDASGLQRRPLGSFVD